MKTLILMAAILVTGAAAAASSTKVCLKEDSSQSVTFTVSDNKTATVGSSAGEPLENYIVTKVVTSKKGDAELTNVIGENNTSYIMYALSSKTEGDNNMIISTGKSGAIYLVVVGPMGKLFVLGSTAACK